MRVTQLFSKTVRQDPRDEESVNATFEKWVHTAGFAFLIGLILLVTYNDILKLVK